MKARHAGLSGSETHLPWRQVFANVVARTGDATTYTAADLNKTAFQVDTGAHYYLSAISPTTWTEVSGTGGAPLGAAYVTMAVVGDLTHERALVAGDGISKTDGGAGGNVTLAVSTAPHFHGDMIWRTGGAYARFPFGTSGYGLFALGSASMGWASVTGGTYAGLPPDRVVQSCDSVIVFESDYEYFGQCSVTGSDYPTPSTWTFEGVGHVAQAGSTLTVRLYDVTNTEYIGRLDFTDTIPTTQTDSIVQGTELKAAATVYRIEAQVSTNTPGGYAYLGSAVLKVR